MNRKIDLSGQRFGLLVVTSYSHTKDGKHKAYYWNCACDCGNTTVVDGGSLRQSRTRSCGCLLGKWNKLSEGESAFHSVVSAYKAGAKRRGLSFELTEDEFREISSQDCFYCGHMPSNIKRPSLRSNSGHYKYNGIDRLDNRFGYIDGNVVPCCENCNKAKRTMPYDEFVDWISSAYFHMKMKGRIK